MNHILLFAASLSVLLTTVQSVSAQIELHTNGQVTMGDGAPGFHGQLMVRRSYSLPLSGLTYSLSATNSDPGETNVAIVARSEYGTDTNIGVLADLYDGSSADAAHYAVYGRVTTADTSPPSIGIYGESNGLNSHAGYFSGDVTVTGTFSNPSDATLKEEIQSLQADETVLSRLMELRPHSFIYTRNSEYAHMALPEGEHYGLIAQEVEEVFPTLVEEEVHPGTLATEREAQPSGNKIRYKSVNYIELIPVLIQAIQEQQATIEEQQQRIEALEMGRR